MATPAHLTLIDGSGFIFRAYHRLPPLTNPEGTPVGAVYGFTSMMWGLIEDARQSPAEDYLAVILDASRHSFRNDLYAEYKANRPPPPEDLVPQFPLIRDAVAAFGVPCIELENYEADDLIASYAEAGLAKGMEVTIVSSDKDLMQLVGPRLSLLDTMQHKRFHAAEVAEKWGVPPERLGDVLALMGDRVDNVPGVPGVGIKTAVKLLDSFGSLEEVLKNAEQVKGNKLRQNLIDHADAARLSRQLVELKRDIALDPPLAALRLADEQDPAGLQQFFDRHGFRSLSSRLRKKTPAPTVAPSATIDTDAYETVTDLARLDHWLAQAVTAGVVGFDTETTSLDPMQAELVGFSLATAPGQACYVPLGHRSGEGMLAETPPQLPMDDVLPRLQRLLENPGVLKIGQNLKYDMQVLARHDITIAPFDDTLLLSYATEGGLFGHGMDELAKRHLDHQTIAFKDVAGSGRAQLNFAEVPLVDATRYAAEDADVTLRLWQRLKPRLWQQKVTRIYEWCDRPLVPVLVAMERAGIAVDRAELARLSAEFAAEIEQLEAQAQKIAGQPFNLGSPKQLAEILFEKLGAPGGRRGRSGQYSTDVSVLEALRDHEGEEHAAARDLASVLLDWRQLSKLRSTYTEALQQQINPETGRVHTNYSLAAASTGRLASSSPNLQNIPVRTAMGRRIRDAFIAPPGHLLLSADYSQIELRLMAEIADVPELKQAYHEGADIHSLTARQIFGIPADEPVDREHRNRAKTINFSIIYGISAFGLAKRLDISRSDAAMFIERYLDHYAGIRHYMAETIARARAQGFVTTLFGRRVHTPAINAKSPNQRAGAERAAINAPVQGTAADLIKRAMIRMPAALQAANLGGTKMLLQVHDELVFEVPEHHVAEATDTIRRVMESAATPALSLSVPLAVEIGTGHNWGVAH